MPASDWPSVGLSNAQCWATDRALLRVEGTEEDVLTVGDDGQVVRVSIVQCAFGTAANGGLVSGGAPGRTSEDRDAR